MVIGIDFRADVTVNQPVHPQWPEHGRYGSIRADFFRRRNAKIMESTVVPHDCPSHQKRSMNYTVKYCTSAGSTRRPRSASAVAVVFALFVGASLWPGGELHAQFSCTGSVCNTIPISSDEYNRLFSELQYQYTNDLFDRMAEAMVLANLTTPYTGTVNLNDAWTVGANVGAGYTEADEIDINTSGVGIIEDVPTGGGAVNARIFFGTNVGSVLGMGYDPYGEDPAPAPAWYSPARFDVYYSALKHTERLNNEKGVSGQLRATTRTESVEIRYHLVEGKDLLGGPLLRFRGVSVGVGYTSMAQRLRYAAGETDSIDIALQEGVNLEWIGQNYAILENNVRSTTIEVRTGIQLLYFLNLTIGGGMARNKGQTDFFLTRFGPLIVSDNPFASFLGGQESANLSLGLVERGEVPDKMQYLKAGLEFNILALKLGIEGIMTRRNYGASVGVRFEF